MPYVIARLNGTCALRQLARASKPKTKYEATGIDLQLGKRPLSQFRSWFQTRYFMSHPTRPSQNQLYLLGGAPVCGVLKSLEKSAGKNLGLFGCLSSKACFE